MASTTVLTGPAKLAAVLVAELIAVESATGWAMRAFFWARRRAARLLTPTLLRVYSVVTTSFRAENQSRKTKTTRQPNDSGGNLHGNVILDSEIAHWHARVKHKARRERAKRNHNQNVQVAGLQLV